MSIIDDIIKDGFKLILKECDKDKNKKRIAFYIHTFTNVALDHIKPYLYTIMAILILLFIMNCFQFYFYIKKLSSMRV